MFQSPRRRRNGGGTGLGFAIGRRYLARRRACHLWTARAGAADAAAQLIRETGGKVSAHPCDIRDAAAVEAMLDAIWEDGPLDGLVNNAAGNFIARTEELSPRAVDAVLNIVLHGTAYVTLACGRRWLAARHPASVLSIVTTYAWTGSAYVVPSAMAKAGVLAARSGG
jgi:NAD(P)-dependent dehydrogenase (short-subunit alcohol dehydrogenase family)